MSTAIATSGPRADAWPLTGRRAELDGMVEALVGGSAKVVVLTGQPGVGKSRLAREAVNQLGATGWTTGWATASESSRNAPLAAVYHLLPRRALGDLAELVADVRARLSAAPRLVIAVDDVHLLDATTLSLLGPLVEAAPARLVVTMPDTASGPDLVTALWRQGRAHVVELAPLDDLAVDTLLHRVLGGPVAGAAALRLLDASEGNPLYLREMVLGSLTSGSLREVEGAWRLDGEPQPSGMLRAIVSARVDSLGAGVRAMLEDLSAGHGVSLGDLISDHGEPVIEAAERAGLIRLLESGRRREGVLTHGLHRDVLRTGQGRVAAARISRRHAARIEERGMRRADDHYRVALLRLDADGTASAQVLDRALGLARAARDLDSLERLTRAGMRASGDPDAARMLAEVLYESGRFDEAEAVLDEAVAGLAGRPDTAELRATLLAVRATVVGFGLRRLDEAVQIVSDPAVVGEPGSAVGLAGLRRAQFELWRSGPAAALPLLDGVPAQADPLLQQVELTVRVAGLALAGRVAEALDVGATRPATERPGGAEAAHVLALVEDARLDEAEKLAQDAYAVTARARLPLSQLWFAGSLGRISLLRGRPQVAMRWYREQLALSRSLHQQLPMALALSGMMTAAAWLSDPASAAGAAAVWDAERLSADDASMFPADMVRGPAWRMVGAGDIEGAHQLLDAAEQRAAAGGHLGQAAEAAYERVRLGRPRLVAERLATYARGGDGALVAALAEHAVAAATDDSAQLSRAADRLGGLGLLLAAAEAASSAAAAAARAGDPRRAAALARQVAAWRAQTEGALTPALLSAAPHQVERLTEREREIAVLVAQGRSSKEIAGALFLSVRTVDNHLQRVFAKLGVKSRAEVRSALEEESA